MVLETVTVERLPRFLQHTPRARVRPWTRFPRYRFASTVGREGRWRRAWVACSGAYASLISTGSDTLLQ